MRDLGEILPVFWKSGGMEVDYMLWQHLNYRGEKTSASAFS